MELGITMTSRCNAACRHCSTSCGPRKTTALETGRIFDLISQAAALQDDGPLRVSLTGGEPFLDFAQLRTVVAYAARLGGRVACVTNAYWATSDERAQALVTELRSAGLEMLAISVSRFHGEYVKVARVQRALIAARQSGVRTVLKCAVTRSDRIFGGIPDWLDFAALADEIECFAVVGPGRDDEPLDPAELISHEGLPQGPCPSTGLVVSAEGMAYICGASAPRSGFHALGAVTEHSLRTLRTHSGTRGKFQILRKSGPATLALEIISRGQAHLLRPAYADVCDLCSHISQDPEMCSIAEQAGEAYETEQMQQLLRNFLGATSMQTGPGAAGDFSAATTTGECHE